MAKKKKINFKKLNLIAAVIMLIMIGVPAVFTAGNSVYGYYDKNFIDPDSDGLSTKYENSHTYPNGTTTNPQNADSDSDGVNDKDEIKAGTDPTVNLDDTDQDGSTNEEEAAAGTDPNDASSYPENN